MSQKAIQKVMTRADVIDRLSQKLSLDLQVSEQIVKFILEKLTTAVISHERVEIRGFGSFEVKYRAPRRARNPKTGETIQTKDRYTIHFKPGKDLRERVNVKK